MVDAASAPLIPARPAAFLHRMSSLSERLAGAGSIKLVAIGSSTTAGEGDIVPYPQRLESALRLRIPGRNFDVMNRGIGGQEAPDELKRLQRDVIDERPSVVIWQVGRTRLGKGRIRTKWARPFLAASRCLQSSVRMSF